MVRIISAREPQKCYIDMRESYKCYGDKKERCYAYENHVHSVSSFHYGTILNSAYKTRTYLLFAENVVAEKSICQINIVDVS